MDNDWWTENSHPCEFLPSNFLRKICTYSVRYAALMIGKKAVVLVLRSNRVIRDQNLPQKIKGRDSVVHLRAGRKMKEEIFVHQNI